MHIIKQAFVLLLWESLREGKVLQALLSIGVIALFCVLVPSAYTIGGLRS